MSGANAMNISEVFLNGMLLTADEWSWENNALIIKASAYNQLHLQDGDTCTISYRFSDPAWTQFLEPPPVPASPRKRKEP
jgi:hypothetical protein